MVLAGGGRRESTAGRDAQQEEEQEEYEEEDGEGSSIGRAQRDSLGGQEQGSPRSQQSYGSHSQVRSIAHVQA